MGLFSNIFSSKPDLPAIDPNSTAASRVAEVERQLDELAGQVKDRLEVVPSEHAAYVFIGKPPKKFGLAWIHDGKVSGLNTLIEEQGVTPAEVEKVIDQLREAYSRHHDAAHYTTTIDQRKIVVTASDALEHEVHDIINRILH